MLIAVEISTADLHTNYFYYENCSTFNGAWKQHP